MKFLCDDNLGKLAKYLRLLGYDTYYLSTISDAQLLSTMLKEGRIVLTKDHHLAPRIEQSRLILIENDIPDQQLRQVITCLNLRPKREELFMRCLVCNDLCSAISQDDIKDRVFPYILKSKESFRKCLSCGRIYWRGSHYKDMVRKLEDILGADFSSKAE
jgi:uncharacterized protein